MHFIVFVEEFPEVYPRLFHIAFDNFRRVNPDQNWKDADENPPEQVFRHHIWDEISEQKEAIAD